MPESAVVVEKLGMNGSHFLVSKYFKRAIIQAHFGMRLVFLTVPGNNLTLSFFIHTSPISPISHFSRLIYISDSRNPAAQQKSQPALLPLQRKYRYVESVISTQCRECLMKYNLAGFGVFF